MAYFGGHVMSRKALWFDQVCVSQSPLARLETIQAIPCFIATAKDMVVLWDEPCASGFFLFFASNKQLIVGALDCLQVRVVCVRGCVGVALGLH